MNIEYVTKNEWEIVQIQYQASRIRIIIQRLLSDREKLSIYILIFQL